MDDKTLKKVMKIYGQCTKKVWKGKEQEIYEYILHAENFLAILWENREKSNILEEIKVFDLEEISFENYEKGRDYCIYLQPSDYHQLISSNSSNATNYSYSYKTTFQIND